MRGRASGSTKLGVGEYIDPLYSIDTHVLLFDAIEGELVRWSTSGSLLVVQYQKTIDVYSNVSQGTLHTWSPVKIPFPNQDLTRLHTVIHPSRIQDVKFVQRVTGVDEVLLVAAEDKKVTVYDVGADSKIAPKPIAEFVGHENRFARQPTHHILSISLMP